MNFTCCNIRPAARCLLPAAHFARLLHRAGSAAAAAADAAAAAADAAAAAADAAAAAADAASADSLVGKTSRSLRIYLACGGSNLTILQPLASSTC
jgi:hypothetical protein